MFESNKNLWTDPEFGYDPSYTNYRSIFNFDNSTNIDVSQISWKRLNNIDINKPSYFYGTKGPSKSKIM